MEFIFYVPCNIAAIKHRCVALFCVLLNIEQNDAVCDARNDEPRQHARYKIFFYLKKSLELKPR
jgi:hypothetical protein